ncbi:MAG: transcriptional regulator [Nanoarchaeota archaeon]|nr:transcriptional regulator [Nanoarchaeota archaeon]MBU4086514.1 transcriptional regulator [Nanoarchaeota archaeon]
MSKIFPEDLEERMDSVDALVSTELKPLILLCLDRTPTTPFEVWRRIITVSGERARVPRASALTNCFTHSLVPAGWAEKCAVYDERAKREIVAFSLTDAGEGFGLPIAAFTLDYVKKRFYDDSSGKKLGMIKILGRCGVGSNRIRIIESLNGERKTFPQLVENARITKSALIRNLESLREIGFVGVRTGRDKGAVDYEWHGGINVRDIPPYSTYPSLTSSVSKTLREKQISNAQSIAEMLCYQHVRVVQQVLSHLVSVGVAGRKKWRGGNESPYLSEAWLSRIGERFLNEYRLEVRNAMAGGGSLASMQRIYQRISISGVFNEFAKVAVELNHRSSSYLD